MKKPKITLPDRAPLCKPDGDPVWHNLTPNRFVTDLPSQSKGPIRARAFRASLEQQNIGVVDPTGTPQLPTRRART